MTILLQKLKNIPRIDYINYLILLYAFTLSFPSEIKRVIVILMILLWLTDRTKYDFKLPKTNLFLFFWLFIGYCLLSYFWSDVSFKEALSYIKRYWYYLPIFIIFKYLKKEFFELTVSCFLIGMFISEILSYGNYFALWQIGLGEPNNPTVFIHHTTYSVFLAIVSIFLFIRIYKEKFIYKKFIYTLFFITITINLLVNSGRTGYVSFFITIIILNLYLFREKIRYIFLSVVSIFLIIFLAYNFSPNFKNRINLIQSDVTNVLIDNDYNTSIGARIGLWEISKNLIYENPIFGVGISPTKDIKNDYIKNNITDKDFEYIKTLHSFHNIYLEILTHNGIVGLFLFFLIIYSILKIEIKNVEINLLKIITLSIYLLGNFVDILFYLKDSILFFSFILGLILCQYKFEYKANKIS